MLVTMAPDQSLTRRCSASSERWSLLIWHEQGNQRIHPMVACVAQHDVTRAGKRFFHVAGHAGIEC